MEVVVCGWGSVQDARKAMVIGSGSCCGGRDWFEGVAAGANFGARDSGGFEREGFEEE